MSVEKKQLLILHASYSSQMYKTLPQKTYTVGDLQCGILSTQVRVAEG